MSDVDRRTFFAGLPVFLRPENIFASESKKSVGNEFLVSVRDFGADGTLENDTKAIQAAWYYLNEKYRTASQVNFYKINSGTLYFPSGTYKYSGEPLKNENGLSLRIHGQSKESVLIELHQSSYFIEITGTIDSLTVENLTISGGAGFLYQSYAGFNVRAPLLIRDCYFYNYSECAILSSAADFPYIRIEGCIFFAKDNKSSIGVSIGGDLSMGVIHGNYFLNNACHLKVSPPGTNLKIIGNDFIRFKKAKNTTVDVWLVPAPEKINAYNGLLIEGNKFGNENRGASDFVLLLADQRQEAVDRADFPYLKNPSRGYFIGARFLNNYYAGVEHGAPFLYTFTPNVIGCEFDIWGFGGSSENYILEYEPGMVPNDSDLEFLSLNRISGASSPYFPGIRQGKISNENTYILSGQNEVDAISVRNTRLDFEVSSSENKFNAVKKVRLYKSSGGRFDDLSDFPPLPIDLSSNNSNLFSINANFFDVRKRLFLDAGFLSSLDTGDLEVSCRSTANGAVYWRRRVPWVQGVFSRRFDIVLPFFREGDILIEFKNINTQINQRIIRLVSFQISYH